LSGIAVLPGRMRALREEVVDDLASSMSGPNGLLQPIVIRPAEATGYYLVAGRHRLEAARKLKWGAIGCVILDGVEADAALLAEIDENLIRADLSPAERAMHVAARKPLYEKLHPETKHGGDRKSAKAKSSPKVEDSFTKDAAKKTGRSRQSVERDAKRGKDCADVLPDVVGTSLDEGTELDALATLPPDEKEKLAERAKAGEKVSAKARVKQIARDSRERGLGIKQSLLPDKKYGVIYADPEWRFEPWSRETGMDRAADNHYPTSVTEVIANRDVAAIAADDCALFLWATVPMLPHALLVMAAWGFDYRSHFVWAKDRIGTGYWNRNRHEVLLVGVRGNIPAPTPGTQWDSLVEAAVGEHSAKPRCFVEMIDELFPTLPKIELNCRGQPWSGWDAWGNEAVDEAAA
jgi:N6-adenosine-specific RNA methylase IME4